MLQVVTGTFPCGQQMQKYGYKRTPACTLCQKAHEERTSRARGASDNGRWSSHGNAGRHMKLLTIETESSLGTLWDQEECNKVLAATIGWHRLGCGHQRVSGHRIQTNTGHEKQPRGRDNGGSTEAVQKLADGSPSDRSKQRVESTTARVCCVFDLFMLNPLIAT